MLAVLANTSSAALVRAELVAQLSAQAVTDELTGLANRRALHGHLEDAMARSRRDRRPLSVLVVDLDGFKEVNDRNGHAFGDQLLREVSQAWQGVLREVDMLGRIGGDEFAVVLEDTDETGALEVITRLDKAVQGRAKASTGHAVWDGVQDSAALLAGADAQMYACKRSRVPA
jgi:diguanylate cyclase (GGDEF)-like protein